MISDFKGLGGVNGKEGKVGECWNHEGTKAYFDDFDHYKMIKGMCRLSCNVCNKKDGGSKEFNSVEQLKGHLFHKHRLFMCDLCLEGTKIFTSEQKLYNRAQLTQHVRTGDSVVDGSESERGGFTRHPICEFCQNPFYGDNELYLHMSTEHFTCHICPRQHPEQYEYFNSYDNLERHNAIEHGGCLSCSKRSAVLQIPTSFWFQQINEHYRHGRSYGSHLNSSSYQMNLAIVDSHLTANAERPCDISSNAQTVSTHREEREIDLIVNPFESLATTDSEPPSRYNHVLGQNSRSVPMEETSFPPLPMAQSSSQQKSRNGLANSHPISLASFSYHSRPVSDSGVLSPSSSLSSSQSKPATIKESDLSTYTSFAQAGPSRSNGLVVSSDFASSSRTSNSNSKVSQATVAPNPVDRTSHKSLSSVPSLSTAQVDNMSRSASPLLKLDFVPVLRSKESLLRFIITTLGKNGSVENGHSKSKKSSKKGKEKCDGNGITSSENILSDSIKVEILPKERHHGGKGKSKILVDKQNNLNLSMEPKSAIVAQPVVSAQRRM
ncbi:hypothetical protein D5086_009646 [Populus alba]|uniref:Uncharacterized protein n=1 Tax=Populus alba TaxID=43335 RepID=A0ACC4C7W2_POPAL